MTTILVVKRFERTVYTFSVSVVPRIGEHVRVDSTNTAYEVIDVIHGLTDNKIAVIITNPK